MAEKLERIDAEIEFEFWVEFAVGTEDNLMSNLAADARSERICRAIYTNKLQNQPFRGGPATYADKFRECYGRSIECRRKPRDAHGRPNVHDPFDTSGPDEDEDEDSL